MNGELAATERSNERVRDLDTMTTSQLVTTLVREQRAAFDAVEGAAAAIAHAVDIVVERLRAGGRLHYFGAGSSGRIATLDASECPPTFGVAPELVTAHIAGGGAALSRAIEGAEDDAERGAGEARNAIAASDAVVGISAGGTAAYVVAAIVSARAFGAATIAITSVADSPLARAAEFGVVLATGSEPIAGSTRMKAGTAQKLVLNTLSTAAMVRLGRVHDNVMIDVVASNEKLRARALRLLRSMTALDARSAATVLAAAGGNVKRAVVMHRRAVDAAAADDLLAATGGFLRPLL